MPGRDDHAIISYNQRTDSIYEFCGVAGPNHVCSETCVVVVGPRETASETIMEANASMQRAFYLCLVMINPLHADLPSLALYAHGACNRFDHHLLHPRVVPPHRQVAQQHISLHLCLHVGHASDGDTRRFSNQLARMSTVPVVWLKHGLDVEGFTLHAHWDGTNPLTVSSIDSQDPLHNLAQLYVHSLNLGLRGHTRARGPGWRAAAARGQPIVSGVREIDLARNKDQQNKEGPDNCCSNPVRRELSAAFAGERCAWQSSEMAGTLAHLELVLAYIILFFGKKATLEQPVELAGFIVHFLRLARLHVVDTQGLTLNFFSR